MPRYVRFTLLTDDAYSKRKAGLLVAAHELRDEDRLSVEEHRLLRKQLRWFNEQLKVPKVLSHPENYRALSWFKPEAVEPIRRMWELKQLMDFHGLDVEVHYSEDPGIVIYEDGWQVVAKPRKGQKIS